MNVIGIAAEYNPFHRGHAHQIAQARQHGADFVVAVMSPDFVQRGEPALADKYTRTQMALQGGADLVLELPLSCAVGSAEYFARGAVYVLEGLGCVDRLCFGCETPIPEDLGALASFLRRDTSEYRALLRPLLARGMTYPQARQRALECLALEGRLRRRDGGRLSPETVRALLAGPNNILAMEYLKALEEMGSAIAPWPIRRAGEGYHSLSLTAPLPSASAIRRAILSGEQDISRLVGPDWAGPLLLALKRRPHPRALWDSYSQLLRLRLWEEQAHLEEFLDVGPDLANRIRSRAFLTNGSWEELSEQIRPKQLTLARVRRCLLHIFLGIRKQDALPLDTKYPDCVRVLGFRQSALPLLHRISSASSLRLITKNASARRSLSPEQRPRFELEMRASQLYAMMDGRQDFVGAPIRRSPVILPQDG